MGDSRDEVYKRKPRYRKDRSLATYSDQLADPRQTNSTGLRMSFIPPVPSQPSSQNITTTVGTERKYNKSRYHTGIAPPRLRGNRRSKPAAHECMVCMSELVYNQSVWSCKTCFKLFHLRCIHQWIKQSTDKLGKNVSQFEWRCPGCQWEYRETRLPEYVCFCGITENPSASRQHPFSCGEPCSRKRQECSHPCVLQCHEGACSPCSALLPKAACFCGAQPSDGSNVRCGDPRSFAYSCKGVCGKLLNCGQHECMAECHEVCGKCSEVIGKVSCGCGSETRAVLCGESSLPARFSCGKSESVLMDCGIHSEEKRCGDTERECSLSPLKWGTFCACRKSCGLSIDRTRCSDSLATCSVISSHQLACGHTLSLACGALHADEKTLECTEKVVQLCRCTRARRTVACSERGSEFLCTQPCKTLKTCFKCKCEEICCKNFARKDFGAENHICFTLCGKALNCGAHACDETHHLGNCKKCSVIVREPRSCNCGKTILNPPFQCGTALPTCGQICGKLMSCGHRDLGRCHEEIECAPCTILVSKKCAGEHETLHQIPCFAKNVSCRFKCGKVLACGKHADKNACHSGPCLPCFQSCGSKLAFCEHECSLPCSHSDPLRCDEEPCRARITATCACGLRIEEVVCRASASYQFPAPPQLPCLTECVAAQRMAVLRQAFRPEDGGEKQMERYSSELLMLAEKFDKFVRLLDVSLVAAVETRSKSLHLPPTDQLKRYLTLEYVQIHYRFETEVLKEGDGLHVVVHFAPGETRIPNPTLSRMLDMQPSETLQFTVDFSENGPKIHLYDVARGFGRFTIERVNHVLKPWIGAYRTRRAEGFNVFLDFFDANKAVAAFRKLQSVSGLEQCRLVNVSLFEPGEPSKGTSNESNYEIEAKPIP